MTRAGGCAIAVIMGLGSACGGSAAASGRVGPTDVSSATTTPPMVTIDILGATIAAGKTDGRQWDGLPAPPSPALLAANAWLGAMTTPYDAVLAKLADLANAGFAPPDVAGTTTLFIGGAPIEPQWGLPKFQDSFTTSWSARWSHVLLDDRVRVRLSLTDVDLSQDDPIGQVELNAGHLRAALANQRGTQVRVSDQHPQILFVAVSVMRE